MPLFGGSRDISLFRQMNRELINDIIQTEIGYYKIVLDQNQPNLYGEAPDKVYYEPVRLSSLITRTDQSWNASDFGHDFTQTIQYSFLRDDLVELNLVPEIGDIILFNNNFFEIDSLVENEFIVGKVPDYSISEDTRDFGSSLSIIVNTHISRVEKLNLIPLRNGVYPTTHIASGSTPANEHPRQDEHFYPHG